jgi:hypothetical protein
MPAKLLAPLVLMLAASVPVGARAAAQPAATAVAASGGDSCRKLPPGKRLKLNLKPNTELGDLVSWISAITCKQFIVPGTIPSQSKTVTIIAPRSITAAEAYDLFLGALDSVGLAVYPSGNVLRVIETAKIRSAPIPFYADEPR